MIIITGKYEWNIPFGSVLQEQKTFKRWFPCKRKIGFVDPKRFKFNKKGVLVELKNVKEWIDVDIIKEKLSAQWAISILQRDINSNKKKYRIYSPGGVVINEPTQRLICTAGNKEINWAVNREYSFDEECGGFVNIEGNNRICEKCRTEYINSKNTWVRLDFKPIINRINKINNNDNFVNKTNEKANAFKMKNTGCESFDNNHRIASPDCKVIPPIKGTGIGFYGGEYRLLEFERVGVQIRLICTYLDPIKPEIGNTMAQIEGNRLKIKKYNGHLPSEAKCFIIENLEENKPKYNQKICLKCKKDISSFNDEWVKLGYCSEKCSIKEENQINKEMMKKASSKFGGNNIKASSLQEMAYLTRSVKNKDYPEANNKNSYAPYLDRYSDKIPVQVFSSGIGFYGGEYRRIKFEFVGNKVKLICTYLEIVKRNIGDTLAEIEGNNLKIKKYNGHMPSQARYYVITK